MAKTGTNRVLYFNDEMYQKVVEMSKQYDKSISFIVMHALSRWLKEQEQKEKEARLTNARDSAS